MKTLGLALFLVAISTPSNAQYTKSCDARYGAVEVAAQRAFDNMPWTPIGSRKPDDLHSTLLTLMDALQLVRSWGQVYPDSLPADICGEPLHNAEALVMIWREKGWLPTQEELDAAKRKSELKALADAIAQLRAAK